MRVERDRASPALPDPCFAGSLVRRLGAPFPSKELQRRAVPQKLFNTPRSVLTGKVKPTGYEKSFSVIALSWQMSGQLPDLG